MKKTILMLISLFCLTGCTSGEEVKCTVNSKDAIFTLKDGIVSTYTLEGKRQEKSEIDEINGTYFTSATNNEEGKEALKTYIQSINGSCE